MLRPAHRKFREQTERWLDESNTVGSHESLADVPPLEFLNDRGEE